MAVSVIKSDSVALTVLNDYIRYAKRNGIVQVRVSSANSKQLTNSGVALGTLPVGFRPTYQSDFGGTPLGGTAEVFFRIDTSGVVTGFSNPSSTYWSGTCTFIAQ